MAVENPLADALRQEAGLLVHSVRDLADLTDQCVRHLPQVVVLEGSLASLRAVRRLMAEHPVPVVLLAADPEMFTRAALRSGAVSATTLPQNGDGVKELVRHLHLMSEVPVFRRTVSELDQHFSRRLFQTVGLVASTGGPTALAEVLSHLRDTRAVLLVVQHMAPDSLPGFADWLSTRSPLPVQLAVHGERAEPGRLYLAQAGAHLEFDGERTLLTQTEPVSFQRPSGTVLLSSLARNCGPTAIGVVLTGLGEDGARGLLEMRVAGGYTLVESASTATALEMPAAALRLHAAREVRPLAEIGPRLRLLLSRVGLSEERNPDVP